MTDRDWNDPNRPYDPNRRSDLDDADGTAPENQESGKEAMGAASSKPKT